MSSNITISRIGKYHSLKIRRFYVLFPKLCFFLSCAFSLSYCAFSSVVMLFPQLCFLLSYSAFSSVVLFPQL
jgi:hypothetical protein